jgi:hypothetical protein
LPECEWTCRVVALASDFNVFASRITTRFSAVFFSTHHIAKAWYVRAVFRLLIRHYKFVLSSLANLPSLNTAILDVAPFTALTKRCFEEASSQIVFGGYVIRIIACRSPNIALALSPSFPRLLG